MQFRTMCLVSRRLIGAALLLPVVMPGAAHACARCASHVVAGVSDGDVLNIRRRATLLTSKVGHIPAGFCGIRRLGPRRGKWVKMDYSGTVGWVYWPYIKWIA